MEILQEISNLKMSQNVTSGDPEYKYKKVESLYSHTFLISEVNLWYSQINTNYDQQIQPKPQASFLCVGLQFTPT